MWPFSKKQPKMENAEIGVEIAMETASGGCKVVKVLDNGNGPFIMGQFEQVFYLNEFGLFETFPAYRGDPFKWRNHIGVVKFMEVA